MAFHAQLGAVRCRWHHDTTATRSEPHRTDQSMSTRIDDWNARRWLLPGLTVGTHPEFDRVREQLYDTALAEGRFDSIGVMWDIVKYCKEMVFDIDDDGEPILHLIAFALDAETGGLRLGPGLALKPEPGAKDLLVVIAAAIIYEVPVIPNRPEVSELLLEMYRAVFRDGVITTNNGAPITIKVNRKMASEEARPITDYWIVPSPVEMELLNRSFQQLQLATRSRVQFGARLIEAVAELERVLAQGEGLTTGDESHLQLCLSQHPILFGVEYTEIRPQHRLGSEYVMDFALIRYDGVVDLVEIESSTHTLFTKAGNPRAALVHAEQQVLDWLQWVDDNRSYARRSLPGVDRPIGFVVIGRSKSLTDTNRRKLDFRSSLYRDRVRILTYDDLLLRAQSTLRHLNGE